MKLGGRFNKSSFVGGKVRGSARRGGKGSLVSLVMFVGASGLWGCEEASKEAKQGGDPLAQREIQRVPRDIYQDAYEQAKELIDKKNAKKKLLEIERQVERELEKLE